MFNAMHNAILLASLAAQAGPVKGIRAEMTVLKGVLVRSGGPGGMRPLENSTLHQLCEQGVLDFRGSGFLPRQVHPVLKSVYHAALDGKGSVLVHCWSGHSAANYWARHINDRGRIGKYGSILRRIQGFHPIQELTLPIELSNNICPQQETAI